MKRSLYRYMTVVMNRQLQWWWMGLANFFVSNSEWVAQKLVFVAPPKTLSFYIYWSCLLARENCDSTTIQILFMLTFITLQAIDQVKRVTKSRIII
jgi:hypothetical protein